MHSSNEAKLIALMKFIITHNVETQSSYSTSVGSRKYVFTDCTAMHSSNEAKLIALMKFIITHNVETQSSYSTSVGSNLTRSQCLSRYISEVFLYR